MTVRATNRVASAYPTPHDADHCTVVLCSLKIKSKGCQIHLWFLSLLKIVSFVVKKRVIALTTGIVGLAAAAALAQTQLRVAAPPTVPQPPIRLANLSEPQLQTMARQVTVKIDGQNPGSGVLFARQGQTYYVLTAAHVVPSPDEYEVITADGKKHPLNFSQVKKLPNTDLAIVPFNSTQNYTIASIGSSSKVNTDTPCYVTGFPAQLPGKTNTSDYRFSNGVIEAQTTRPLRDGYALAYYNFTFAGMSGGPIFNQQGQLIGIHGASKTRFATNLGIDPDTNEKAGLNLGIPIDTFLRLAPQVGLNVQLPAAPPANPPAQPTAADLYLQGVQLAIEGKNQEALNVLNQSLKINPNYAEAYAERGLVYSDLKDYKAALENYNQALRLDSKDWHVYNNRGIARFHLKDLQGAIADYDQALKLKESPIVYYNRGNAYSRSGNSQRSIADYDRALQLNPKYASVYRNRGNQRNSLGQTQAAITDYNQALQLTPNDAVALSGRGGAKMNLQDFQGALADFNAAIKANPQLFIAYVGRGAAHNGLKNPQAAIADYTEAIRLKSDQPITYFSRGFGRVQIKDYQGAMADYNQALKIDPEFVQAYYGRGLLKGIMGDLPGATADLERTADLARKQNNQFMLKQATDLLQKLRR
jgi:tetratricopeptide (TPR) repeat protein